MIHFVFSDTDKRYLYLKYDTQAEYIKLSTGLMEKLNPIDPVCFMSKYKGEPFRQEFMWEYTQKSGNKIFYCAVGLWQIIWKWLKENNLEYDGLDEKYFKRKLPHTFEQFKEVVDSWNLVFTPRPYQYEVAYKILQWNQSLSEAATRAGKTLIAYMIFRYSIEYLGAKKILMIVPSIDLVKQGYEDFSNYAEFFKTECLWGGGKIVESSNLTIATFQTLIHFLDRTNKKYNPRFFDGYDVVFVDETHRANAFSIKTIISQPFMKNVKISFGMTGTLPKENTIERYCLQSLLGAKIQEIKAKDLMDAGYISKIQIYQHRIEYADREAQIKNWCRCAEYSLSTFDTVKNPKDPNKKDRIPLEHPEFLIAYQKTFPAKYALVKREIFKQPNWGEGKKWEEWKKYLEKEVKDSTAANHLHIEMMTVHFYEERIDYLIDVLKGCPNNTLILAQHVEYIKHIAERLKTAFPDRKIICVYGGSKERKTAKQVLKDNNNCIMVAGYSIMGTGMTLSNLCYGVLFESFASDVINTQSIGRGLGLSDLKDKYVLHDFTDKFDEKLASNKIFLQGIKRTKIYKEREYPYKIIEKTIGKSSDDIADINPESDNIFDEIF